MSTAIGLTSVPSSMNGPSTATGTSGSHLVVADVDRGEVAERRLGHLGLRELDVAGAIDRAAILVLDVAPDRDPRRGSVAGRAAGGRDGSAGGEAQDRRAEEDRHDRGGDGTIRSET